MEDEEDADEEDKRCFLLEDAIVLPDTMIDAASLPPIRYRPSSSFYSYNKEEWVRCGGVKV